MSTESRLAELADLHQRGVISDAEYADARRAALGLGQQSAAPVVVLGDDHIVVGTAVGGVDPSPQLYPMIPTVICRCGEAMIYVPAELAIMQVTRKGRRAPSAVCCSCRFPTTGKFVCPATGCGVSLCDTCGRSCGVPYGAHHQWINQPQKFQTTLVGDWCQDGQTCVESLCYIYLTFHVGQNTVFQHGKPSKCQCVSCFMGTVVMLHEIAFLGLPLACIGAQLRQSLRSMYGIQESFTESCCTAWICRCCSIAQVHREMKNRGHDVGNLCKPSPVHYRPQMS
jgi:Cys-rich protein (TIGR01571 family)